jgi:hypothetical protein
MVGTAHPTQEVGVLHWKSGILSYAEDDDHTQYGTKED